MSTTQKSRKPTRAEIRRAVASSTAIETGQSVAELEKKMKARSGHNKRFSLAD